MVAFKQLDMYGPCEEHITMDVKEMSHERSSPDDKVLGSVFAEIRELT